MFFESQSLSFNILDVFELKQGRSNTFNRGRNFCALSFRFRADTLLKTETQALRLTDNCVCYVPARLDYRRISEREDELIVVHFQVLNSPSQSIECLTPKDPDSLAALFRRTLACWNQKEAGYRYRCSALLYEILAECYAQSEVSEAHASRIAASVNYLTKHYASSDLTIKELADQSFMSEVYFRRLFKEEYGISPQKYLIKLRIQHAIGLISTGYYSIKEIAYLSGYRDHKYFSVEFKKVTGISPSEYLYNFR